MSDTQEMTMKLLYSATSPYARKVRAAITEKGLDGITCILVSPFDRPADLIAANPLSKVPCLVLDDGSALYDSPVICEYLDTLSDKVRLIPVHGSERWTVLRQHALCDGVIDAAYAIACEMHRRPPHEQSKSWIEHWCSAIQSGLDALESEITSFGNNVTIAHIGAGCALSYLDFRTSALFEWRAGRPHLVAWYADFAQRPSMRTTHQDA